MHEVGAKVIGISDKTGGLYNPKGLDIPTLLIRYQSEKLPLRDIKLGEWMTNEELLTLPCTVLVPAALSEQITAGNALAHPLPDLGGRRKRPDDAGRRSHFGRPRRLYHS